MKHEAMADTATIRADFDRLAPLVDGAWSHNVHYYSWLLRRVPGQCERALDLGCGTGDFARQLARRSTMVVGLDLSPRMIERARARCGDMENVVFATADITRLTLAPEAFDCIVSIATLHHLPLPEILVQLRQALRPNGVLLVLDLYASETCSDRLRDYSAIPVAWFLRLWHTGRLRPPLEERTVWAAHTANDRYPTLRELARVTEQHLPGSRIHPFLLGRYGLVWRRPISSTPGATT